MVCLKAGKAKDKLCQPAGGPKEHKQGGRAALRISEGCFKSLRESVCFMLGVEQFSSLQSALFRQWVEEMKSSDQICFKEEATVCVGFVGLF